MGFLDGIKKGLQEGAAKEIVTQLYKKVEAGGKDAMINLGLMFLRGDKIPANAAEAYRLFKMAADLGEPAGFNNMGVCYENGQGVPQNLEMALECYQKAAAGGYALGTSNAERVKQVLEADPLRKLLPRAEAGDVEAQVELGWRYSKGEGVGQDFQQAIKWLKPAAQACHLEAQFYLGQLYAEEMHLPSEGIPLLKMSADNGYMHAQAKLGFLYAAGKGVEKDLRVAIDYLRQAALQGSKEAANNLALAEKQLAAQNRPVPQAAPVSAAPAGKRCTQCGAGIQGEVKFCSSCGAKIEQIQFCTGCGAKLVAGTKFCSECGAAAGGAPPQPATQQPAIVQPAAFETERLAYTESANSVASGMASAPEEIEEQFSEVNAENTDKATEEEGVSVEGTLYRVDIAKIRSDWDEDRFGNTISFWSQDEPVFVDAHNRPHHDYGRYSFNMIRNYDGLAFCLMSPLKGIIVKGECEDPVDAEEPVAQALQTALNLTEEQVGDLIYLLFSEDDPDEKTEEFVSQWSFAIGEGDRLEVDGDVSGGVFVEVAPPVETTVTIRKDGSIEYDEDEVSEARDESLRFVGVML